jgi:hypothetical protein
LIKKQNWERKSQKPKRLIISVSYNFEIVKALLIYYYYLVDDSIVIDIIKKEVKACEDKGQSWII